MTNGTVDAGRPRRKGSRLPELSRRGFVALLGAATAMLGLPFLRSRGGGGLRGSEPSGEGTTGGKGDQALPIKYDRDTLVALGFVLIPSSFAKRAGAGDGVGLAMAAEEFLRNHLDHAARSEPVREDLRSAAAFLDGESMASQGRRFADLDLEDRRRLIEGLLRPFANRRPWSWPYYHMTERGRRVRHLWTSVAQPVLLNFLASDLGWRVVGYSGRPGGCSDLVAYQFPPS